MTISEDRHGPPVPCFSTPTGDLMDGGLIPHSSPDSLCTRVVERYRADFEAMHPFHPWTRLSDEDLLVRIGAAAPDPDGALRLTRAGLLMFGHEYEIAVLYPRYMLDYRSVDAEGAWTTRVSTNNGRSSGALYEFYRTVEAHLVSALDDTDVHKSDVRENLRTAVKECFSNAVVHADYSGRRHVIVERFKDRITFANPGLPRVGLAAALRGGVADPRNPALMKMFHLVGVTKNAGTGVPLINEVARSLQFFDPVLSIERSPDRTELTFFLEGDAVAPRRDVRAPIAVGQLDRSELLGSRDEPSSSGEGPPVRQRGGAELPVARNSRAVDLDDAAREQGREGAPRSKIDEEASARVDELASRLDSESLDIIRLFETHRRIKRTEVQDALGVGSTKAKQLLASLVMQGILRTEGNGRGTNYVLSQG